MVVSTVNFDYVGHLSSMNDSRILDDHGGIKCG